MKNMKLSLNYNLLIFFLSITAILIPCCLLFHPHKSFYIDWDNHLWLIGYYGEYFKNHLRFPLVINTNESALFTMPIFYGAVYYRLLGLISSITGAHIAIRIGIVLLLSLQFATLYFLIKKITQNYWLAFITSSISLWTIYPITNLYNRSALTEFFASSLLTTAICFLLYSFETQNSFHRTSFRLLFALCFSISFGCHPITAFYGGIFILVMFVCSLPKLASEKNHVMNAWVILAISAYIFLTIFPWLYVTFKFADNTGIAKQIASLFYFEGDQILTRIAPFPIDPRLISYSINGGPLHCTPFLDVQLNTPFLLLWLALMGCMILYYRKTKGQVHKLKYDLSLMFGSLMLLVIFSLASLLYFNPLLLALPKYFRLAQFAYRFVTYQNLAILIMTITGFSLVFKSNFHIHSKQFLFIFSLILMFLSLQSLFIKLIHGNAVKHYNVHKQFNFSRIDRNKLTHLYPSFYGHKDYVITSGYNALEKNPISKISSFYFPVGEGKQFGELYDLNIDLQKSSYIGIRFYPFPWNHLYIDGQEIKPSALFWDGDQNVVKVNKGHHLITAKFEPDRIWVLANDLSFLLIILMIVYLFIFLFINLRLSSGYKIRHTNSIKPAFLHE